jgi:uncharacterized protein YbjT (DUF2867 family)
MTTQPILVVGGTGNVGNSVVRTLHEEGHAVRVLTRDSGRARQVLGPDIEIVEAELEDPASLPRALDGVEATSLATSRTPGLGVQEANFIDAAATARVKRLVKLSGAGTGILSDAIHRGHQESEARLAAAGIPAVVLHPMQFMSNLLTQAESIKSGRLPSVFGDGKFSFIDPHDVAELMARALVDDGYVGESWTIGGPETLTYDDLAATFADALGREVVHTRVDVAPFREAALRDGLPDFVVEMIVEAAAVVPAGHFVADDQVVRRVLGRPATPFRDWLVQNREAFAA